MNVFEFRDCLVADYQSYTRSFIKIRDARIRDRVDRELNAGAFWPELLLQLNLTFLSGGTIDDLTHSGTLHPECGRIFRIDKSDTDHTGQPLLLHTHQQEAILKAKEGKSYVLTSGTGSGKSLTYIVPIVDHVLRSGSGQGIQAIVVYPMNDRNLKPEACKLLSFTDNRQDASLQAGHFNDFAQVTLLRSALHKATQDKGGKGLSHGELSRSVFEAMQLGFNEYAADPEVRGPARNATHDALHRVINYYLYHDLQRGWRSLYRSAVRQRELHHKIIGGHSRPEIERNHSRRLRAQAESQIHLLTEAEGIYEGDFYS